MNRKLFDSMWRQIRSQTTGWWSLMSDYDLIKVDKAAVKLDKYVTMLQVKYGYTREQAIMKIARHVTEYEAEQRMAAVLRASAEIPGTKEQSSKKNSPRMTASADK
jgi:hypothetical protein